MSNRPADGETGSNSWINKCIIPWPLVRKPPSNSRLLTQSKPEGNSGAWYSDWQDVKRKTIFVLIFSCCSIHQPSSDQTHCIIPQNETSQNVNTDKWITPQSRDFVHDILTSHLTSSHQSFVTKWWIHGEMVASLLGSTVRKALRRLYPMLLAPKQMYMPESYSMALYTVNLFK